jgi:hypothetical protein
MSKPMIRIHDIETNEIIDREMTDDEFAQYESDLENSAKAQADQDAKQAERVAILEKLGLTADEIAVLFG